MRFLKPSATEIASTLKRLHTAPLSYDFAGLSHNIPAPQTPAGFVLDQRREIIGQGDEAWQRAKQAIREWIMFANGWTALHAPEGPPRVGNVVGMLMWIGGFWWLNPSRVLYEIDEESPMLKRFGFGYGTLAEHAECGEERFLVEQNQSGEVFYDLAAFSRPRHPLVRLCSPLARLIQLRFGRDSMQAMRRFVAESAK
ncbi:DUF1990 family protein [Anatilimnocola floriformis]|uniref:DUF1990 family protein n=1 Tax=Anatilimnocola floriformis TaxID=2948575 RepID=UPI0020C34B6B|nr:DUF1990 domain-containing protein [Anatilimnocola floriformis]